MRRYNQSQKQLQKFKSSKNCSKISEWKKNRSKIQVVKNPSKNTLEFQNASVPSPPILLQLRHHNYLRCLLSRENLNSRFAASYIQMAITFNVLDQFQENKVSETAQIMYNIPGSSKNGSFVIMETETF